MKKIKFIQIVAILVFLQLFFIMKPDANSGSTVSIPGCEYQITFPTGYKKMPYNAGGNSGLLFVSTNEGGYPALRAQCLAIADRSLLNDELVFKSLNAQAESFGLSKIQTVIERTPLGIIGTYTGRKTAGGIKIIQMGRLYIGGSSVLNLVGTEPLKSYPSKSLDSFFSSVRKMPSD